MHQQQTQPFNNSVENALRIFRERSSNMASPHSADVTSTKRKHRFVRQIFERPRSARELGSVTGSCCNDSLASKPSDVRSNDRNDVTHPRFKTYDVISNAASSSTAPPEQRRHRLNSSGNSPKNSEGSDVTPGKENPKTTTTVGKKKTAASASNGNKKRLFFSTMTSSNASTANPRSTSMFGDLVKSCLSSNASHLSRSSSDHSSCCNSTLEHSNTDSRRRACKREARKRRYEEAPACGGGRVVGGELSGKDSCKQVKRTYSKPYTRHEDVPEVVNTRCSRDHCDVTTRRRKHKEPANSNTCHPDCLEHPRTCHDVTSGSLMRNRPSLRRWRYAHLHYSLPDQSSRYYTFYFWLLAVVRTTVRSRVEYSIHLRSDAHKRNNSKSDSFTHHVLLVVTLTYAHRLVTSACVSWKELV